MTNFSTANSPNKTTEADDTSSTSMFAAALDYADYSLPTGITKDPAVIRRMTLFSFSNPIRGHKCPSPSISTPTRQC